MSDREYRPRLRTVLKLLAGICTALLILAIFSPFSTHAFARATVNPTMQINVGFGSRYRDGDWIPVQVNLVNNGPDFDGMLSINATGGLPQFSGPGSSAVTSYQQPITLPNGAQKQITLYIPTYFGEQSVTVTLLDNSDHPVLSQVGALRPLATGDTFVATLSDQNTGFGALNSVLLPNQGASLFIEPLNASTMPNLAMVLKNFNLIVLDNFTTSTLSKDQLVALQTWVDQGGALIVAGGPEWQHTMSALPAALAPASVRGTSTLPTGTNLLSTNDLPAFTSMQGVNPGPLTAPLTISTANPEPGSKTLLAAGKVPLIIQASYGEGTVCYLAFDPTFDPIAGWAGATFLWKGLLLRTIGDQLLVNNAAPNSGGAGQSIFSNFSGVLQALLPNVLPSPLLLLVLLLGYLLILGPIRLIIVRWSKRRDWSWRIALSTILVFSLLTYGIAFYQKGNSAISSSISVMRLGQGGALAHTMTYFGVFVPSQGDFQVHVANNALVQPSPDGLFQSGGSSGSQHTVIALDTAGTNVTLQNVNIWTQYALVAEQDRQPQGGITSNLALRNGTLTGTITNTFGYGLSDAYVLIGNSAMSLGYLAAGQVMQVNVAVHNQGTGISLADEIAQMNSLPFPYNPYADSSQLQTQTSVRRHIAILTSLSGEGGSFQGTCGPGICNANSPSYSGPSISNSGTGSIITLNGSPTLASGNSSDPLLLAGAPATLIGWADQTGDAANAMTVNGNDASGTHETLIQAPLPLKFSGQINLPIGFTTGRVIDAQGTNLQTPAPGMYGFSTGSMTFEFASPDISDFQATGLTITVPSYAAQVVRMAGGGGGTGPISDASHLRTLLYNWQTGAWDALTMNQSTITTGNASAYIGPDGRILLQVANQNTSLGTMLFNRPLLSLQGVVPGS